MNDNDCWSSSIGRWFGIPVRIHMLFYLFVATVFCVQWYYVGERSELLGTALATSLVLLLSVVIHEAAHLFTLSRLGGHVNQIVLTPWGGNSDLDVVGSPRQRVLVCLSGPLANGLIFAVGAIALLASHQVTSLAELINPLQPYLLSSGAEWGVSLAKIITWINFQIMIVNLIPCYPFDGQPILRAIISGVNPDLPSIRRESTLMVFGHAVGLTFIGLAWFLKSETGGTVIPPSVLLIMSGIVLLFAARYSYEKELSTIDEDWDDFDDLNYDSIYGDTSFFEFEEPDQATYSQWLLEKKEERELLEFQLEQQEEGLVDEVLEKLHHQGIASLSPEERNLLDRVSERIRRRRQQGV
ncbi:MAG: site-2 protease family protein [Mariniblastus sp.]|nr:site-2 protease family protein [Mariniblastus sp.]